MPRLMGLGIEDGSYFIAQSEEAQAAGKELRQARVRAFVTTGPRIAATARTAVFTFGTWL
jgi:predicted RND superfamily exporter protein